VRNVKAKAYENVSFIYEELMKDINYADWAKYIQNISSEYVRKDSKVLEIGAGNCKIANLLNKKFPGIIASDISLEMLKSGKKNVVKKVCCDMSFLPFDTKFGLVFSTFDSVNYLMSKKKLLAMFKEVKLLLADDGIFTFDVSLEKNSLEFLQDHSVEGSIGSYTFKRVSKFYKNRKVHKNIFYITGADNKIVKEVHEQKIYEFETYFDLIFKAGLYVVDCFETFTFKIGNAGSDRIQFILKKAIY
jgi:ubiquinone/menaquinone biosynthesis C-methylase UbiE